MNVMQQWWRNQPRGRKTMVVIVFVVFALITAAAIFGWVRGAMTGQAAPPTDTSKTSTETPAPAPAEEETGADEVTVDGYSFKTDENGMVVMPVTTDPREAAAGAAAVAFSVDFGKLTRQEFVDEAIQRMTHPSDEYRGPEGEIHTLVESRPFEETQRHYWAPERVLHLQADSWALRDNPENYSWWTLLNGAVYDNFTLLPDHFWLAQPELVMDETEMTDWYPDAVPTFKDGTDMTPDTAGATLSQWWVLSDVENSQVGTAAATTLYPAHFAIWCDAPEEGGLCGVAYTLDGSFPASWPRQ